MKILSVALLLCTFPLINGQYTEPKFGKVEMADLAMTRYDKDTSAAAMILFDNGNSQIIYSSEKGFQYQYERHMQVKIFKNSAFGVAENKIRLYRNSSNSREDLKNLTGVTYNLEDGKIVKTKLDNKKIYKTDNERNTIISFAMPDVKEGSIIELSYIIVSDFLYNFRGWSFQYRYPARWSQYIYEIPEYFVYSELSKGYLSFDVQKREKTHISYSVSYTETLGNSFATEHTANRTEFVQANGVKTILATKDVPAFIPEPYTDCDDNYIQAIEFELSSILMPNLPPKTFAESWESVNKRMIEDKDFGLLLNNHRFVDDTVATICKDKSAEIEKAAAIYDYIRKNIRWNGDYKIWAMNGLKKPFEERVASSSEVNLLLTLMLNAANLNSHPVMISTRDNGIALSHFPTISKYNSILSMVTINGKIYLLDATQKNCPFGILPANDLNGQGRVVDNYNGDWVDLTSETKYDEDKNYSLNIDQEGKMTGSMSETYKGYAGLDFRNTFETEKSKENYVKRLQEETKGLTIAKYVINDKDDIYKPVSIESDVEITDNSEVISDKIMFNPLLFERTEKNRFMLEERKYPVNYNYPLSEHYVFEYTLPAGYIVETMPESFNLSLPDNSISISYKIQNTGNKIQVEYNRNVNKVIFLPSEYARLKGLYDQMIKKHSEEVIIKKSV